MRRLAVTALYSSVFLAFIAATGIAASGSVASAVPAKQLGPVLVNNGSSYYVIAVAKDAIPAERTAAQELRSYLKTMTGATLRIASEERVNENSPQILIGAGTRAKRWLPGVKWRELGPDGIVIKTVGNSLVLAGGRPRGALYATYQFLENSLGVRWWAPQESSVPKKKTVTIAAQNTVYRPALQTREEFYTGVIDDPLFATRLKINGQYQRQGAELGGHDTILGWVHTIGHLLPVEKYFPQHPEWFSDPANGGKPCTASSPQPAQWQLCVTNEDARRELTKNALAWIRKNPEARVISISQNDNKVRCAAPADLAIEEREGSASGPLLEFVNAVAADIEKEYPHILVETLAYQYTRKPPRTVRPRRNVVIRLCSIDADFAHPLNSPANAAFRDDLTGWKAIAPRLYVWDYLTNFNNLILPHPNMRVIGPNIRFFAGNNVIGLFEQGDGYSGGAGDLVALRTWLVAHLMWNPSLDQRKLEDEFLAGYYGAAAPHLRAYIDGIQDTMQRTSGRLDMNQSDLSYLSLDVMTDATRRFDLAQGAVAKDPVLSRRLRRDRLALDHAWLLRYKTLRAEAARRQIEFRGPADIGAFAAEFVKTAQQFKVRQYAEGQWFEKYVPSLLARFGTSAPLPDFLRDKNPNDVLDFQEGEFRLYVLNGLGSLANDPKASNGRAARMEGHSNEWIMQCPIQADTSFLANDKWHGYLMVRVQPAAGAALNEEPAVEYGLLETSRNFVMLDAKKKLAEMGDGEYHVIDLGAWQLTPGMYVFAAPPGGKQTEAVFIDRVVFVREKSLPPQ